MERIVALYRPMKRISRFGTGFAFPLGAREGLRNAPKNRARQQRRRGHRDPDARELLAVSARPACSGQAPAVFLDKDGALVDNVAFNVDRARARLAAGAAE